MFKRNFISALIFGVVALAPPALAQPMPNCMARDALVERLSTKYEESQTGLGLQNEKQMLEVWSSPTSGSYTIFVTRSDGVSCVISYGKFWQSFQPIVAKPETTG